jgi:hypothetical protein
MTVLFSGQQRHYYYYISVLVGKCFLQWKAPLVVERTVEFLIWGVRICHTTTISAVRILSTEWGEPENVLTNLRLRLKSVWNIARNITTNQDPHSQIQQKLKEVAHYKWANTLGKYRRNETPNTYKHTAMRRQASTVTRKYCGISTHC